MRPACLPLALGLAAGSLQAQVPPPAEQIAAAVRPAPAPLRAGARVMGYAADGSLVTLRPGTNELVCRADDPADRNFHVACYHRDLEPFMARGRALRAENRTRAEIDSIREAEIEAGTLAMPRHATALYSLSARPDSSGTPIDPATDGDPLHVVYTPYATPESSGITATPARGVPWLMYPGRPWAHVMIIPERPRPPAP